jgi:hypothetical protein
MDGHDLVAAKLARSAFDNAANEIAEIHILLVYPDAGFARETLIYSPPLVPTGTST